MATPSPHISYAEPDFSLSLSLSVGLDMGWDGWWCNENSWCVTAEAQGLNS